MKVKIKQEVLEKLLRKGAKAAISEEVQTDTTTMACLIKSIKITVDKNFVIESASNLMAIRHSIPATKENGIIVDEEGCILIPGKEFVEWVKVQSKTAIIEMSLSKLKKPEVINPVDDLEVNDNDNLTIQKIGTLKMLSKDVSKARRKWELDCYEPSLREMVDFSSDQKKQKHFDINAKRLSEVLSKISFAASQTPDYEHVIDSISMQVYNKNLYFVTTDTKRCALYKMSDIKEIQSDNPLLVSVKLLMATKDISDDENTLSFYYNDEIERIFISQPNLDIRLASPEKENIKKFANIKILLQKDYTLLSKVSKIGLYSDLKSCELVNKSSALFEFSKGKPNENGTLVIRAVSEDSKHKPSTTKSDVTELSRDFKAVWGVHYLLGVLEKINGDEISLYVPDNSKSVKLLSEEDPDFSYFSMVINNPKYDVD